ncbi:MAG TPA: GTP 3',8-cyclase MoaA [Anaeromyxobacteraceae bacterium]|nr:GTP 3',8-cyclase MoaA [Anaeromyxobacteraceae bacterium]
MRPPLADAQGRTIAYLRLSLTDRCNFRCEYCSPADHEEPGYLLTRQEITRLARLFGRLGVRRIRLTGGEPTLRREVVGIVEDLRATPGIEEVALTTNGHRLAELSGPLKRAGLTSLNVSLDTLDPARLSRLSGRGAILADVLEGIDAAAATGFPRLKVNTVVVGGVNEDELGRLARHAWTRGASPRFIELMPFGQGKPVPTARVKEILREQGLDLVPDPHRGWGPAHYMREAGSAPPRYVGFIGALTENFCDLCNRARVAADGGFQACLGGDVRYNLRDRIRAGASDADLEALVRDALLVKAPRHRMEGDGARLVLLPMMGIGG